jgi:hypothetical protein
MFASRAICRLLMRKELRSPEKENLFTSKIETASIQDSFFRFFSSREITAFETFILIALQVRGFRPLQTLRHCFETKKGKTYEISEIWEIRH